MVVHYVNKDINNTIINICGMLTNKNNNEYYVFQYTRVWSTANRCYYNTLHQIVQRTDGMYHLPIQFIKENKTYSFKMLLPIF